MLLEVYGVALGVWQAIIMWLDSLWSAAREAD